MNVFNTANQNVLHINEFIPGKLSNLLWGNEAVLFLDIMLSVINHVSEVRN